MIGDLASHWIHLARWLLDDNEVSVGALASAFVERQPRPDGGTYEQAEDSAVLTVRYASGAYGVLQVCAVSWEGTPFNQTHHLEVHGDAGTIYAVCDWDTVQEVRGVRRGERGPATVLPIPDDIWGGVRRDNVHDTYRDVFRGTDARTRGWITAIAEQRHMRPDFADGSPCNAPSTPRWRAPTPMARRCRSRLWRSTEDDLRHLGGCENISQCDPGSST